MAEIMLAIDNKNYSGLKELDKTSLERFIGIKLLANETYMYNEGNSRQRPTAVSRYARGKGARNVMLDTRFSYDKPDEVIESTRAAIAEMLHSPRKQEHIKYSKKPDFMTVHHDVPEATMRAFAETALGHDVTPVCLLTSSRFSERDFRLRGRSAADNAKYLAEFISNEQSEVKSVICAAADAQQIKEVNPELVVFATGGLLTANESTTHDRPAFITDTVPFVDVFIIGSPILRAFDPMQALDDRFNAIAA